MSVEVPGKILEVHAVRNNRLGLVDFGDTRRPIFLDLVPDAKIGDYVTVHVGFATGRMTAEEAKAACAAFASHGGNAELDLEHEEASPAMSRRQKPR
jgi:hydrogenase expression/formation protein HypC